MRESPYSSWRPQRRTRYEVRASRLITNPLDEKGCHPQRRLLGVAFWIFTAGLRLKTEHLFAEIDRCINSGLPARRKRPPSIGPVRVKRSWKFAEYEPHNDCRLHRLKRPFLWRRDVRPVERNTQPFESFATSSTPLSQGTHRAVSVSVRSVGLTSFFISCA
jgi:hypothetical protein